MQINAEEYLYWIEHVSCQMQPFDQCKKHNKTQVGGYRSKDQVKLNTKSIKKFQDEFLSWIIVVYESIPPVPLGITQKAGSMWLP